MKPINVEEVIALKKKIRLVNKQNIMKAVFHYKEKEINISIKDRERWKFTGLNIVDFIGMVDWDRGIK